MKTIKLHSKALCLIITIVLVIGLIQIVPLNRINAVSSIIDHDPTNTLGRGIDLITYGRDYVPSQVVRNNVATAIDSNSPCVQVEVDRSASTWSTFDWSDNISQWGKKQGFGGDAAYNGSDRYTYDKAMQDNIDYFRIQDGSDKYRYVNKDEFNIMTKGMGSASFSLNYANSNSYNTRSRYYRAQTVDVVMSASLVFLNGYPSPDRSVCQLTTRTMTELEKLQANSSVDFTNAINEQIDPNELVNKWGHFILTRAGFGAKATLRYEFESIEQAKSSSVNSSVSGGFKGISGTGTGKWSNESTVMQSNGELNMSSFGGYSQPKWNINTENASAPGVISQWQADTASVPLERLAYVGAVEQPNLTQTGDKSFQDLGIYIYNLIPKNIISPTAKYPDASQCVQFTLEQRTKCEALAGTAMPYAVVVESAINKMFYDAGKTVDAYAASVKAPYVKDIYFGYSGDCTGSGPLTCNNYLRSIGSDGKLLSRLKKNLDDEMANACRYDKCVKLYGETNASLNSGAQNSKGVGDSIHTPEIVLGYTLTENIREAIVSFNIKTYDNEQNCNDNGKRLYGDSSSNQVLCNYIFANSNNILKNEPAKALNLNRGVGGKYIYIQDVRRYNPNVKSSETINLPITAIGVYNRSKEKTYPKLELTDIGTKLLSTGPLRIENQTIWKPIGVNLNEKAKGGGHEMYLYIGH